MALKLWAAMVAILYAMLAYGSYVTLPSYAGGMLGFDMRPLGMSKEDGLAFLAALTEQGRTYYQSWLKPLDTVFILAFTGLLIVLSWRLRGVMGLIAGGAAIGYGGTDFAENELVSALISFGSKGGTADMVAMIANITTAKFLFLGLALVALFTKWRPSHARR